MSGQHYFRIVTCPNYALSARLKKLVACGIIEQVPASDGSAYQEYALTQKRPRTYCRSSLLCVNGEKVISSPAARNVFRFWISALEDPLE